MHLQSGGKIINEYLIIIFDLDHARLNKAKDNIIRLNWPRLRCENAPKCLFFPIGFVSYCHNVYVRVNGVSL